MLPPSIDCTALAVAPDVVTEPPRIVVVPPVDVRTPYIDTPLVETVVSVSLATPPLVKLWYGPL